MDAQEFSCMTWPKPGLDPLMTSERNLNVDILLNDLKSCGLRRDLQRGRRVHMKAVESQHASNMYVVTALIRMYGKCGSMVDARYVFDSIQSPDVVSWNFLLHGYADNGDELITLNLFSSMKARGCEPNSVTYVAALKACTSLAENQSGGGRDVWLKRGRQIHSEIACRLDIFLQSTLTDMYAKCGSMEDARYIFETIREPNVVCWNALLLGYVANGEGLVTLEMFLRMKACGCAPDSVTYIAALKACTALACKRDDDGHGEWLKRGREIHVEIGCDYGIQLQSTLIDMYGKCGSIEDARSVFDSIQKPNVVCWNALLLAYVDNGEGLVTLNLFSKMKACGYAADSVTYIAALKACTYLAGSGGLGEWLNRGRAIHSEIGCDLDILVQNTLIDMYGKCGSIVDARGVFGNIRKPNVVSWTALLQGYVENGDGLGALELYSKMKTCECAPNSVTYVAALKACTSLATKGDGVGHGVCLKWGREIHLEIGCDLDIVVQCTLTGMYAKCGSMVEARWVFESIRKPNVFCWNAVLLGYVNNGNGFATLELFSRMKACGCVPDSVTYIAALKACTFLARNRDGRGEGECLKWGKEIHAEIGCHLGIFLRSSLIEMYAKCRSMVDARRVFEDVREPNVVCWNALLLGYVENGDGLSTLKLVSTMKAAGCAPDSVTYVATLKACVLIGALTLGRKFHSEISDFTVQIVTCLVELYSKCGSILEAHEVFDAHSKTRDVSTWTALLTGYASFGDTFSVFKLFEAMQDQGFQPDSVTFVCMLSCCSHAGLVEKARKYFKAMPIQYGVTLTLMHYNCMVDILGRANQLTEAVGVVQRMPCNPDIVTWMTLLGACRKWKNVEIGRYAFESLVNMDKKNSLAYVLMAHIYGSKDMWEEKKRVLRRREI